MSTAARKARKRAGIKFERTAKIGTPVAERQHDVAKADRRAERALRKSGLIEQLAARFGWNR